MSGFFWNKQITITLAKHLLHLLNILCLRETLNVYKSPLFDWKHQLCLCYLLVPENPTHQLQAETTMLLIVLKFISPPFTGCRHSIEQQTGTGPYHAEGVVLPCRPRHGFCCSGAIPEYMWPRVCPFHVLYICANV